MNSNSNNNSLKEILIEFYNCELRLFKQILGIK